MATRLFFPVFILGLNDALQPWPFSCSADPLTMTATSALFSHHVAPIDALFQSHGLFSFFSLPYLAHCSQRRLLFFVAFSTSRKWMKRRGGCRRWCEYSPVFPPPRSYRPTSAVNRCGPWIPGSRVVWSAFPPASWRRLSFPLIPAVCSPTFADELRGWIQVMWT